MRRWIRTPREVTCGYCAPPRRLARGEPILLIEIIGVKRAIVRCAACAGPAPELPPLVEPVRTAGDFEHVAVGARREWMPYRED
jgi:hypothetical protein